MKSVITRELAIKAVLHGACRIPRVGQEISRLSTEDLIWVENIGCVTAEQKQSLGIKIPIWVLSVSGYGYGSGSGDGYGSGDGSGSGDGY